MKTFYILAISLALSSISYSQNFEWAEVIDFSSVNEVASLDVNDSGDVFLVGVHGEGANLPYLGESYIIKSNSEGEVIWIKNLGLELIIADAKCVGNDLVIVGRSLDVLQCDGAVLAGSTADPSMFIVEFDSDGNFSWINHYTNRHGQHCNLDYDDGVIALQCRGAFNSGNHIMYFDIDGGLINSFEIEDYSINEIAYYDGMTYVTGGTSIGQALQIDNVNIPAPETESLNFVLAFDEDYIAEWGHAGNAINGLDNQIVAGEAGVFSYQSTLLPETFTFTSTVWKFDTVGNLLAEVFPPVFTNAVSLYPDLDLSDCHLSLFARNDFNFNSHELIIFNHDLEVIDEKQINGSSNLYSGQVASHDSQIYVSQVHTDDLDFNGEQEIIDLLDDAFQYPYLAKVAVSETCEEVMLGNCEINNLIVEMHECEGGEFMIDLEFYAENVSDSFVVTGNGMNYGSFAYGQDFYTLGSFAGDGSSVYELIITDFENSECSAFIEFDAQLCPVGDCFLDGLEVFDMECVTDSTYNMTFNVEITDPGNEFIDVWVNNEFWNFYEIANLPLTLTGITARESNYDIIQVCVNDNEFCCMELEYMVPDCIDDGACVIEDLELFDKECSTDSTYSMTFNAEVINGPTDFIEVSVNNEYLGLFDTNDLPITVDGITPRDSEQDIIMICASGLDACCFILEYERPDCLVDNVEELQNQFLVYPNPVEKDLILQLGNEMYSVAIFDSSGKEVYRNQYQKTGEIDVSFLSPGMYQIHFSNAEEQKTIRKFIKK